MCKLSSKSPNEDACQGAALCLGESIVSLFGDQLTEKARLEPIDDERLLSYLDAETEQLPQSRYD